MREHLFEQTVQKTHAWINETLDELRWTDPRLGYVALRAVLHALRDRLTVESAVKLGAQLPQLVRGFYYEGWRPTGKPLKERGKEEFLEHIREEFEKARAPQEDFERVAKGVFTILSRNLSAGEIDDVIAVLPHHIRDLWPVLARTGVRS